MPESGNIESTEKLLRVLLACYIGASLLHFSHNAEYLSSYPNCYTKGAVRLWAWPYWRRTRHWVWMNCCITPELHLRNTARR